MKKHVPGMTSIAFTSVKGITDGQLPDVRGLRGHLLYTVKFLVYHILIIFYKYLLPVL